MEAVPQVEPSPAGALLWGLVASSITGVAGFLVGRLVEKRSKVQEFFMSRLGEVETCSNLFAKAIIQHQTSTTLVNAEESILEIQKIAHDLQRHLLVVRDMIPDPDLSAGLKSDVYAFRNAVFGRSIRQSPTDSPKIKDVDLIQAGLGRFHIQLDRLRSKATGWWRFSKR